MALPMLHAKCVAPWHHFATRPEQNDVSGGHAAQHEQKYWDAHRQQQYGATASN